MNKKNYISPEMCLIETDPQMLLSGSAVHSIENEFEIDFGGIDEEGIFFPG